ncbi:MAG: DUF1553 domain-containing protein [Planctomycetaceae bacterium]
MIQNPANFTGRRLDATSAQIAACFRGRTAFCTAAASPSNGGFLRTGSLLLLTLAVSALVTTTACAEDKLEYNRDIRPILAENCFACHGADSAARKADLRLDRREAALDAGAIAAGNPNGSGLIERIDSDDADLVMPPAETKKVLTPAQKNTLRRWIAEGAEYQSHWSLIPPVKPQPPAVKNEAWAKNEIDRFVLAKLEAHGLTPAEEAEPRSLYRRLHLDITGLPPAPQDVDSFVADYRARGDEALSEWIDRLMSSTAWGEQRARYWLDAARYADTHGLHFDNYREMWPYRDWVIRSFNANQPFDQFTIEQLAGDLLDNPTDDQLIATGFQRCNITTNEGGTIDEENLAIYATDRVQTFGWVFLGLTTNCGQCHDHKFDPLTMRDFYSLAAYFRNTTQPAKDGNVKDGRGPVIVVPTQADQSRWHALPEEIATAVRQRDERKTAAREDFERWLSALTPESPEDGISNEQLVIHVPLTSASDNQVLTSSGSASSLQSTGEISWVPDGRLGPAPVMKPGGTFDLGDLADFETNQPFSDGAWIRSASDTVSGAIIARMDEQNAYRGWDLWQQGRAVGVHIIDTWPGNAIKVVTKNDVLKTGEWQHVFATYDGSGKPDGIRIYVNGFPQETKIETNNLKPDASIHTTTSLRIGQRSTGQVFEGGAVQDVRVYARALGADEVKAIADTALLRSILSIPADQRTPEQQASLFDHYLNVHDPQFPALAKAVTSLEEERDAIRKRSPVTHIQQERKDSPAMAHILMRGEYDKPGEEVSATTPAALHPLPDGAPKNRLGLAEWVVDPTNPLTARVTVNRFWQELFGQGIVATPEDFGVMGSLPSHQDLLDWLAVEYRESGWNTKRLFKLMLMSATYRQSAAVTPEKLELDRDNVLLSRGPRFRMAAEMVRDYALAVSGLLSPKMYGPGVKPYQPEDIWNVVGLNVSDTREYVADTGENLYRRSLYTFWKRMAPPPNMEAFNAPNREVCTVRRERTNTPLQALVTLNDPVFVEAARHLAENAIHTAGGDDDARIVSEIARRALFRSMNDVEMEVLLNDKRDFFDYYQSHPDDAKALTDVGESPAATDIDAATLAAWTMVCNQVLNLDEVLNK